MLAHLKKDRVSGIDGYDFAGILVIGGQGSPNVFITSEFWSANDPVHGSCQLSNLTRKMFAGPTVNLVNGKIVGCYLNECDIYQDGEWKHLQNTRVTREFHSAVTAQCVKTVHSSRT